MSKGDADGLRADTDDGFARIANLLLEALACSPLSGAQLRVIMFIMRRTYGWARANQRATGQMDTITAAEIEQGTGLPHRTVESAVARLAQMNVILSERVSPDNRRRYGVNPEINDWGLPTPEWALMKPTLQDARDTYTYKPVQLYGNVRIPLLENAYTSTQNCVQGYPENTPERPENTPESVPTDSITDSITDSTSNGSVSAAPSEPAAPTPPKPLTEQLAELQAVVPDDDWLLITEYLDLAAAENTSGDITLSRRVNETRRLIRLRDGDPDTGEAGLGVAPWRYGMEQAINNAAPNANYVKKAASRQKRNQSGGNGRAPRKGAAQAWTAEQFAEEKERMKDPNYDPWTGETR